MANPEHLDRIVKALRTGLTDEWNRWRASDYRIDPQYGYVSLVEVDLSGADFSGLWSLNPDLNLADVNFQHAKFEQANFLGANLRRANFQYADLSRVDLRGTVLNGANMQHAFLKGANLGAASLIDVDLSHANLSGANLTATRLQRVNLAHATLSGCYIYGVSAWDLQLENTTQENLVITPYGEPPILVDNLEVAQFIYQIKSQKGEVLSWKEFRTG